MKIDLINEELLLKGNKEDLLEFADYIKSIANSNNEKNHLHLDDLTIISKESNIKNIVIEKI